MNKEEAVSYIRNRIYRYIDVDNECTDEYIRERISREMHLFSKDNIISVNNKDYISKRVFDSIRGLDVLEEFLRDDCITEIMVNGTDNIFIEKLGSLYQSDSCFEDEKRLNDTAMRIASRSNRIVNAKNPILDTVLDDGSRVCVVLSPVSKNGTSITIRKFYDNPLTMEDLINGGTISEEAADYLINAVKQKKNIFMSGGTGSGKTTLLGILGNYIDEDERVVTIEDSAELNLSKIKNWVRLETRGSNTSGDGEITIRRLIKTALRMRPDRLIVGEVRGDEAIDMLQALNTGHAGSLSTGHANSSKDMISRLETMVLYGLDIPIQAIRVQIASALDIIVHLSRMKDKSRKVIEISEITGMDNGNIVMEPVYLFEDDVKGGEAVGELKNVQK
ncbi:MAG: CpaF family protein [Lachnospiraceae bacterium]|nr:CpaF family protein [Lachnospiraceae bacterium]